jgi:molybdopterin molybdotransferase
MVRVTDAEALILLQTRDYGTEQIPFDQAFGRVLAEDIKADRDLPPCNRVTMDGIAIRYASFEKGIRIYNIKSIIAAGETPVDIALADECVEIMTGAALPQTVDTVVRYEDVVINNGTAAITANAIKKGQNLHLKGRDKKNGELVAAANEVIDATVISMAASVGKSSLLVKKLPKVVIISTGGELVGVDEQPTAYQVRRSNNYMIKAVLQQQAIVAGMLHIPDNPEITEASIETCLQQYDVLILSGGVSMGKFDYVPQAMEALQVTKIFHKVAQRPGKPFWFGSHTGGALVFAFPGNPVSTFLCLHRYFLPWLSYNQEGKIDGQRMFAILGREVTFSAPLQYFLQVKLDMNEQGQLIAIPMEGNGSGDFANLIDADGFMELPLERDVFRMGEVYRVWRYK